MKSLAKITSKTGKENLQLTKPVMKVLQMNTILPFCSNTLHYILTLTVSFNKYDNDINSR